ncbi:MAG: hypothetical protein K9N51_09675 [Candidatus Pacebacteria bacterium]|nr:hypothetical protein [Candidatus Paceibacterota bacterium]
MRRIIQSPERTLVVLVAIIALVHTTCFGQTVANSLQQAKYAKTVSTETELVNACNNPDVEVVYCPSPIQITQEVDLADKDIVAGPRAFVFGEDGRLVNGRSISRLAENARYPVFMGARIGRYIWYSGSVTYNHDQTWLENLKLGRKGPETGTTYKPRHDGIIPPAVFGAWNDSIRDVTMWSQFHEGRHNDAIEAAQNSLPGKGKACDRTGTIKLPAGTIHLTRPIYYTVGMQIAGSEGNNRAFTTLSVSEDFEAPDRLWDLDDNYAIIGVPQNRNNQTRVAVAGGGGRREERLLVGAARSVRGDEGALQRRPASRQHGQRDLQRPSDRQAGLPRLGDSRLG